MSRKRAERDFIADDDEPVDELLRDDEDESDLDLSSDDGLARVRRTRGAAGRGAVNGRSAAQAQRGRDKGKGKAWEGQFERTWDQVQEDERGSLEGAVSDLLLTSKSRRCAAAESSSAPSSDSPPFPAGSCATRRRSSAASSAMSTSLSTSRAPCSCATTRRRGSTSRSSTRRCALPSFAPSSARPPILTRLCTQDFVTEFFDQNPIGQMAVMVTRDGLAERLTPLSGSSASSAFFSAPDLSDATCRQSGRSSQGAAEQEEARGTRSA